MDSKSVARKNDTVNKLFMIFWIFFTVRIKIKVNAIV